MLDNPLTWCHRSGGFCTGLRVVLDIAARSALGKHHACR